MYRKVLVPLDGSKLAECSLEEVKKLADVGLVGEIILLSGDDSIKNLACQRILL